MGSYAGNMTFGSPSIDLFRSGRDRASLLEASVYNRPQIPEHSLHGVGYGQELSSDIQNFVIGCVRRGVPVFIAVAAVTLLASSSYAAVPQVVNAGEFHSSVSDNTFLDSSPVHSTSNPHITTDISSARIYEELDRRYQEAVDNSKIAPYEVMRPQSYMGGAIVLTPHSERFADLYRQYLLGATEILSDINSDGSVLDKLTRYTHQYYSSFKKPGVGPKDQQIGSGEEIMDRLLSGVGGCADASALLLYALESNGIEASPVYYELVDGNTGDFVAHVNVNITRADGVKITLEPTNGFVYYDEQFVAQLKELYSPLEDYILIQTEPTWTKYN